VKRGFKKCKNPDCSNLLHIHTRVCSKCHYEFEFAQKKEGVRNARPKENAIELARKISEYQNEDKIPKKYLESICMLKKNIL
jgi:DNA-directed RNA polymerase subunit M/transcription elongation factor TFIIS